MKNRLPQDDVNIVKIPTFGLSDWEQGEFLDHIDDYDQAYEVSATDENGKVWTGYGIYSCDELVDVEDIEEMILTKKVV